MDIETISNNNFSNVITEVHELLNGIKTSIIKERTDRNFERLDSEAIIKKMD
jgi:hypothetical protein